MISKHAFVLLSILALEFVFTSSIGFAAGPSEVAESEIQLGNYWYDDTKSPFLQGPAQVSEVPAGGYILKAARKFVTGTSAPFKVHLQQDASRINIFRGQTLAPVPTSRCGTHYAKRVIEIQAFSDEDTGVALFYMRETGQSGLRCNSIGGSRPGPCTCWWSTNSYDFTHPKRYVKR
ncbi:hypothetical protein K2X33_09150 [bacterium]|nr:hypothetical protein [bacterium]